MKPRSKRAAPRAAAPRAAAPRAAAPPPRTLACERDGVALPEGEARQMWEAFSAFMDAEAPDGPGAMEAAMDRFARTVGMSSARPGLRRGAPVLVLRSR